MKTNIKIVFLGIVCISFFLGNNEIYAKWYNPQWQNISIANCPEDEPLLPDAIGPTLADLTGPLGGLGIYFETATYGRNRQAQVTTIVHPLMQCYYWDSTSPTASNLEFAPPTASGGWQNTTTITLKWNANDTGGSGLKDYDIRVYRIAGAQGTPVTLLTTLTNVAAGPGPLYTYNYTGLDGYAYAFEVCPRDNALNICTAWTSNSSANGVVRIDTTPPSSGDLSDTSDQDVLATDNQNLNLSFNDAAAPVKVWYRVEKNGDPSSYDSFVTPDPYSFVYPYIADVSNVDIDRDPITGGREVTILIDKICDQAGNCVSIPAPLKIIPHNVYANPNYLPTNPQDTLEFDSAVADGQPRNFIQTISDGYGNVIIPATGINRDIRMNLSGIINSMFLNQYTRSTASGTSVFVMAPNNVSVDLSFGATQSFPNVLTSPDGSYPLEIKVYTPTENGYASGEPISDPWAEFGFTMNLVVTDDLGINETFSQSFDAPVGSNQPVEHYFAPLYLADINGNLRNGGFIEGTEQQSRIDVNDNSLGAVDPASIQLQLEFSGANVGDFNLFGGSTSSSTTPITPTRSVMTVNPGSGGTDLYTKLEQIANKIVSTGSSLQLSTHYSYLLDGKNVLYNGDVIGKPYYFSTIVTNIGNQVGAKVIGPIASNTIASIVDGQFADSTSIFSGLTRSVVRNNIAQSVAMATRNMQLVSAGSSITNFTSLPAGAGSQGGVVEKGADTSIIQLKKTGGNFTLSPASGISGKRTLVVKGANVYIDTNMFYANSNSILGVVIQKDKNGNGGNLYISPAVTNVVGTYIIDGSIMSYDGANEIGVGNIGVLKNQLHIFGSIVSENTLGGSRMNPIRCPSLLNISCSTPIDAQKYDLNYLRRYYLYGGKPFGNGLIIGGETCVVGSCTNTSSLPQLFTTPTDDLAKYPVIIEYNPLMRMEPPIGFEQAKD
ncbi:hypothetical protein HOO68_02985 [Candidatus Gracilibacteria bacterium]|nr:hypothetical protein [Candidatus Gracilibacteria bacterium]